MGRFFRENWIWIVAPIVIALLLFAALFWLMGGDESSPFNYNIW